jgi:Domain of unknown function (DUF4034)
MRVAKRLALVAGLTLAFISFLPSFPTGRFISRAESLDIDKPQPKSTRQPGEIVDPEVENFKMQIALKFMHSDLAGIDQEAKRLRTSKERVPGGYWKLRLLYDVITSPLTREPSTDGQWEDLIKTLDGWVKQQPESITARVALAEAWDHYAWRARGTGRADTVSEATWKVFNKRLATAGQILYEAADLKEKCPQWYLVSLWVGLGQSWEREAYERVFQEAVELEPTYYYFYQAKANYLLPRWFGEEGDWEQFAEDSAVMIGGHQGDIVYFAIYAQMRALHDITFMNTHQKAGPRLIAGFRSIEKLYGSAPHRLNEACFFASASGDNRTAKELFERIGDNYDKTVWGSKGNFDVFRQGVAQRAQNDEPKAQGPSELTRTRLASEPQQP